MLTPEAQAILDEILATMPGGNVGQMAAATRYARLRALADQLWADVAVVGYLANTDRGGDRLHPVIQGVLAVERQAADVGQALGIEPVKRPGQPGRPKGATSAPDRATRPAPPKLKLAN